MNYEIKLLQSHPLSQEVRDFIVKWHYSKSYKSQQQRYVFGLFDGNELIGVALYGKPMGRRLDSKWIELRRFCTIDNTKKNTESYFLGYTLRWLKKNTEIKIVVSYSDPNRGHVGTIYKATNFKFDGLEKNTNPQAILFDKKYYHMRQYYQKRKGIYTKDAVRLQDLVKLGKAKKVKLEKKLRYLYKLGS